MFFYKHLSQNSVFLNFALLKLFEIHFQGKTDRAGTRVLYCSSSVTLVVKIDNKDQYLDSESTIYRIHYILYQPITNNVKSFYQDSHLKYTSVLVCLYLIPFIWKLPSNCFN